LIFIENESIFLLVKEMEYPELPALDIEKATKALQDYKKELEEMKCEGLTDKQAGALIKFTQELIPSNETEK
jgi:hypothetical protein